MGVQSSVGAGPAQGRQQAPHPVKGEQKILDALSGLEEDILLNDLVSEDALVNVGLSSAHPQDIPKMVTKDSALYARFQKRAAEAGGAPLEPRKKARSSSGAVAGARAARPVRMEAPNHGQEGRGPTGAFTLACPAPISQRSGWAPAQPQLPGPEPSSSRGAAEPHPPSPARPSSPGPSGDQGHQERVPYAPGWEVFEGDSALYKPQTAREVLRVALLPADQAKVRSMSYGAFMDTTICSAIRRGQEEAEARRLASEAEQKALQAKVEAAEDEIRALNAELEEEKGAHALARSELRASEARLAEATSVLAIREQEVKEVHLKVEEEAKRAIQLFRKSEEFQELMEEEAVDGLVRGSMTSEIN
ncbi:vasodilator-stimulated phosphoprotein-like [Phoenix dactylifera]|uniref:Vasodilator-stimulated phosphoprotein-like n=1 Tax=Phoenix dactylifera TaxID=42345 RepID=A0A8B9AG14_PHODC|nr:vasodilator-stimulated phosphoprotein-like [Phoenix dactylifera]